MSYRVHVGGLPSSTRTEDVEEYFSKYYPKRVDLKHGFAFLEFADARDMDDAIHDLHDTKLNGVRISVSVARSRQQQNAAGSGFGPAGGRRGRYRVEVENMAERTSWQDLKDFAREAGNVTFTDVFYVSGKKTGVIEYSNEADMLSALKKLDDTKLDGNYVRLYESTGAGPVRDSRPDNRSGGRGYGRSRSRSPRGRSPAPRGRSRSRSPIGGRGRSRSRSLPKRDRSPARSKSPRGRSPSPRARSRSPAAARARSPSPRRD